MDKHQKKRIKDSIGICVDYNNLANYDEIKDQIRPYDIIGFRGGDFVSNVISYLQSQNVGIGVFTHVGMVVTSEILPSYNDDGKRFDLVPGKLYLLESTLSFDAPAIKDDNRIDVISGKGKVGVQLRDLKNLIPRYISDQTTKVAWCRLVNNPINQSPNESDDDYMIRKQALSTQFQILFDEYYGRRYELSLIGLLSSMFPSLRIVRKGRDAFYDGIYKFMDYFGFGNDKYSPAGWQFCSELIANIYQAIGIIPNSFDAKDVLPVDFLGYDQDGLPALVEAPVFINDWDLPNQPAVIYIPK
jgi:hypothetical protein